MTASIANVGASHPTDTDPETLEAALAAAARAADELRGTAGDTRAAWLRAVAAAVDADRPSLLDIAAAETHLPAVALGGEISRTVFQLEHLAQRAESPDLLEVVVDDADPDYPVAPRPRLIRALQPLGPVLVFTASNFPFAFSVAGNDTASALAAGCPVVVKAHPGHPRLSGRTAEVVARALDKAGAPAGTFAHIVGTDAGVTALRDPRIKACGFTGSVAGGRTLFDIASSRPDPIPFYGELGSLNPVVVTPEAAAARSDEIAQGLAASITGRGGQLCTKPGVVFVPAGSGIAASAAVVVDPAPAVELLTPRIAAAFTSGIGRLAALPGAQVLAGGSSTRPTVVSVPASALSDPGAELEECFGPAAVVVEYDDPDELPGLLGRIGPSLTATVHGEPGDQVAAGLVDQLSATAGRVIWNGWPTGVSVSRAMQHGGPYPATTSPGFSSIGADSVYRWLRPVTFQNWPDDLLPAPVREALPS
jgi:NADP-dependent aldehyde dehydrogenase